MNIGRMRHRVTHQQSVVVGKTPYNDDETEPETLGTYWADVSMLSGRELVNAQQVNSQATHQIRMRYIGPITPDQWFLFNGTRYNIESVNNVDNRNREYRILCKEVVVPTS